VKCGARAMLKKLSFLVALVAAVFGVVSIVRPQLFLLVPKVGFVLWAMTGHPMPPFLTMDAWEGDEHLTWLRDGDVVVAANAKSGTTWMLYCAHQIRTKAADDLPFRDVSYATPWPEMLQDPDLTWAKTKVLLNTTVLSDGMPLNKYWDHPAYPFRVFKSHNFPREAPGGSLPVRQRPGVKFLAMARNHADQVASFVPFFNQHTEEYRKVWGGFPPGSVGDPIDDAEERLGMLAPGGPLNQFTAPYTKGWWAAKQLPNVLLLHYADAVKDLPGLVLTMASFFGVPLTETEHAKVVERCSMDHMKKISDEFLYRQPLNKRNPDLAAVQDKAMVNKGGVGTSKIALNDAQRARWAALEEDMYADAPPELLSWVRSGSGSVNT